MNLNEALEYALRLNGGRMNVSDILTLITNEVIEEGVDAARVLDEARSAPARFQVENGELIHLRPERLADRVGFFRKHLRDLQEALRPMPPFSRLFAVELVLVHALAVRPAGVRPSVLIKGQGLWPILDQLAEEFPGLQKELRSGLEEAWFFGRVRVDAELHLMASAGLTPIEYVHELRSMVMQEKGLGQFALPWSVAELMARLLGGDVRTVFDPMADAGALPAVLALHPSAKGKGMFLNPFGRFLCMLQARILEAELMSGTYDAQPEPALQTFEHCISAPSFSGKVPTMADEGSVNPQVITIKRIIDGLADGGRAVVLVPESLLFGDGHKALRQRLLTETSLSMVVRLPDGLFRPFANIKTSLLVIDRNRSNKELDYIDARTYAQLTPKGVSVLEVDRLMQHLAANDAALPKKRITHQEVLQDDQCGLTADRWFNVEGILDTAHGTHVRFVPLAELVSLIKGHKSTTEDPPYFQVAELASDAVDLMRTATHGRNDRPASARDARILDEPALLLARVGGNLKPSVFDPGQGPIALGTNVWAFRVDDQQVDPLYLALELRSGPVQEQVNAFVSGSGVPALSKHDLFRVYVRVPPKEEQERIVAEQLDLSRFMARLKDSGEPLGADIQQLSQLIAKNISALGTSGLKNVLMDLLQHETRISTKRESASMEEQLKLLRHESLNTLGWVSTGLGVIDTFTNTLIENGIIPEDMPVGPALEGQEAPPQPITEVLDEAIRHSGELGELIERLTEPQGLRALQLEQIELEEYLRTEILPLYQYMQRFRISLQNWSNGSTTVYADRFALKLILKNIISNANKHGFTDMSRTYTIHIVIMDNELVIGNDGHPPTMRLDDMKVFGRKEGPAAGTGMGLYFADTLTQQMGGELTEFFNAGGMLDEPITFALNLELLSAS